MQNNLYINYLRHHGILGQRWGKKNGPPYPIGSSDHSASEKKAGWRKSLDKSSPSKHTENNHSNASDTEPGEKKKGLTDRQKRAIKIGAAVVATALVSYGTYKLVKSGKLDKQIIAGKAYVDAMLGKKTGGTEFGQQKYSDLFGSNSSNPFEGFNFNNGAFNFGKQTTGQAKTQAASQFVGGIKKLARPETVSERIKNTNPIWLKDGNSKGKHNCVFCGIAAYLRGQGYDVTAKGSDTLNDTVKVAEKCFKNPKVISGAATKFGRSRADAAEMLVNKFGQNAEGLCRIQWSDTHKGHCFNWVIKNGAVEFFDAQANRDDSVTSRYWSKKLIDPNGLLDLIRLDGCEINKDAIFEFIENNNR